MEFMDVTGAFFAPDGEPLSGAVSLKPSVPVIRVSDGVVVQSEVSFPVVDGRLSGRVVAPSEGVNPSAWSYRVVFKLKRPRNFSVSLRGFDFPAQTGTVDLNAVAPVPSPVVGDYVTRGERGADGVSVVSVAADGSDLVFTMSNGETFRTVLPVVPSKDGVVGRDGRDGGEVSGQLHRFFSPITYFWADWYNRDNSKWLRVTRGMPLGFVILNIGNGSGESLDPDFLEQSKRARNAGAKLLGYVRTDYGRRDRGEILAEIRNHREWYQVDGVFLDEAINGWGEQESLVPAFVELYQDIKSEFGEDFTVVTNPGSNTVQALVDASDVQMCFENSADKYLDTTFPDFYQQYPAERFWHVIHDATVENVPAVLERATYLRAGHLYVTDDKFVPSGDPQAPASNPYDDVPSQAILDAQRYWVTGTDTLDSALAEIPAGADGRGVLSITSEGDVGTVTYSDGSQSNFVLPRGLQGERGERGEQGTQGVPGASNTLSIGTVVGGSTASATVTGASPNQVLNLVLPKGDKGDAGAVGAVGPQGPAGNVTVSQAASTIQGNGYPEGVVSAPVGSLYVDLQETNGAVMWRKKSGTGSTGWVVLKGDTGWRKVSSDTSIVTPSYADAAMGGSGKGSHAIRRVDNQVHWLTYWYQNSSTSGKFAELPKGFRGQEMVPGGGYGTQEIARLGNTTLQQQNGQRLMVTSMNAGELRFYAQWNTDDPYPNTLPGSPA